MLKNKNMMARFARFPWQFIAMPSFIAGMVAVSIGIHKQQSDVTVFAPADMNIPWQIRLNANIERAPTDQAGIDRQVRAVIDSYIKKGEPVEVDAINQPNRDFWGTVLGVGANGAEKAGAAEEMLVMANKGKPTLNGVEPVPGKPYLMSYLQLGYVLQASDQTVHVPPARLAQQLSLLRNGL